MNFIDTKPLDRIRRSVDLMNWQSAHMLFQQLYLSNNDDNINLQRKTRSEFRPVEGPMNIEQLPAMLAARLVKRYPYSQENDPAVM